MKRKGFTLVELLIVIVVISVLAAMMMISSNEAVSSAKATAIVNNLKNLKAAALEYYADNMTEADGLEESDITNNVIAYLRASEQQTIDENYTVVVDSQKDWYAIYKLQGTNSEVAKIRDKLRNRADAVGLFDGDTPSTDTLFDDHESVAMSIR